jgi:hypothetical protein
MNFTPIQIANECRNMGRNIMPMVDGVDSTQLLWAISGVESSFGVNCNPRYEAAFDTGGAYDNAVMAPLLARFGSEAAKSYGPWQIMFVNAPTGFLPTGFTDLRHCSIATIAYLNKLIRIFRPINLAEIGNCWNGGHVYKQPYPAAIQAYVGKLQKAYDTIMPTE